MLGESVAPPLKAVLQDNSRNPSAWQPLRGASSAPSTDAGGEGRIADASAPAWSQHIQQVVRHAVLDPLRNAPSHIDGSASHDENRRESVAPPSQLDLPAQYKVIVVDALGMPADLPRGAPQSFEDLLELSPSILRTQLQKLMERKRYRVLTPVQAAVIPLMLEYRDVLCIAPTATGKTLCYVYATLMHLLLKDINDRPAAAAAAAGDEGGGVSLNRRQVETFLQEKIDKGEVCPYCELNLSEVRVCPMTGFPHPSASELETDLALRSKERRAKRLEELQSSVAEPRVLVLVPNGQLASQVSAVFRSLHCDYRIHCMVRASSAEEQRKYLQALEGGVDVLVASPETILPALYKHKLSLRRVQTVVMDEVDDIVSVNHFEPMKIILGALPKGVQRPQRLLLGASLPPVAYEMIKTKMLLPSHRFVLVDLKTPAELSRAAPSARASSLSSSSPDKPNAGDAGDPPVAALSATVTGGFLTARTNLCHLVFMVGRAEKVQKLAWLYETGKLNPDQRTLIFCNSRHNVAYVCDKMKELVSQVNFTTLTSHASSSAREGVLKMFRTGVSTSLICTDLLSRGIDFQGVVYVVHYDMPTDMETWMHRCGRCGRGGSLQGRGYIYTFFQPENIKLAKPLVGYLRQHQQLVPPRLREYAKQSFIDVFNNSLFHHPTRPHRKDDPQNSTPVLGRGTRRFPDYKQGTIHKHFRPH
ncbi:putative DEAD/DEAH box helicase [Leishmania major strain Friedlin]|uniref:ATP-dependent RNA helicase n=1 Tax=Leishmania major TaxID=5664 RepID=Q4Q1G8_LEIMA|nr:putative DEAD/DEAH box helicase [Leishmania major strain Friedlin]CAG9583785.1 ATP-dependent_DEAD/H_RNA_helicase_-_putative [Leishmania major strain Friedlin]CAJ09211.1 putative DEAD/DEAH box helicase [Leishmania major strain Friedlin]|eukprot:XP_001686830.1 putative DEAD/DEAH box helicase [Leishmania major strain Friedlin]